MNKTAFFFTIACIFLVLTGSKAQVDILQPPSSVEKKEFKKAVADYLTFVNDQIDTSKTVTKKAGQSKFLKERLASAQIFVYNDIDSLPADDYINFFKYIQKLSDTAQGKLQIKIDTARIYVDKIKYDKIRKYHFADVKATKEFVWTELKPKFSPDSGMVDSSVVENSFADTLNTKDSLSGTGLSSNDSIPLYDTIVKKVSHKVTLYIKFDKENNVAKNFKFIAFTNQGKDPKYEPLPPLITWWLGLEPEWKAIFREKRKLEEYPREFDIEKLTGQFDLDVSGSAIKSLEPLKSFHNLEKLNCSNTLVSSLEPLASLKHLKVLDISKTKIDTLIGLEKLTNLEEFYTIANNLEGIAEVSNLINLRKLNCSENMLLDITPVKGLTNLRDLNFSLNIKIKSVEPIKDLDSLEKLSMRKIDVRTLDYLKKMKGLIYLDLFNTNISNIEPLRGLHKITYLDLSHNKMPNLEPIKNYRFITELYLYSSSITNLSDIKNYEYLRVLDISNTQTTDLGPVHKFEDIKVLKAFYTKIKKEEIQRFKKNHPRCQITYY